MALAVGDHFFDKAVFAVEEERQRERRGFAGGAAEDELKVGDFIGVLREDLLQLRVKGLILLLVNNRAVRAETDDFRQERKILLRVGAGAAKVKAAVIYAGKTLTRRRCGDCLITRCGIFSGRRRLPFANDNQ
ncbi:hypothetical protein FACS1894139_05850 [Planctomycetales bacterium]|nr:hypothetical protein FACS1894107_05330 [Planctomycetales bacterium]GHS97614.1 hypothetical protein FACS1894108_04300 [Planctomycetales bacterium]GHT04162.1 hypothetical protein FACS1894139_05850 [Planctomycetales bacterium]